MWVTPPSTVAIWPPSSHAMKAMLAMSETWATSFSYEQWSAVSPALSFNSPFVFLKICHFVSLVFFLFSCFELRVSLAQSKKRGKNGQGRQERPSDENDESKGMHGSGETACIRFLIAAAELNLYRLFSGACALDVEGKLNLRNNAGASRIA